MVPLPGNSKLVQTQYSSCDQDVLASQLASIAASIDSMRTTPLTLTLSKEP
ncbi:hypothetical protein HanPSC8_Chr05g0186751 [Helianthus annuus]|nr:hypothetical protein HanPSC8_Chr05g0186751 [Helianthus annuus]